MTRVLSSARTSSAVGGSQEIKKELDRRAGTEPQESEYSNGFVVPLHTAVAVGFSVLLLWLLFQHLQGTHRYLVCPPYDDHGHCLGVAGNIPPRSQQQIRSSAQLRKFANNQRGLDVVVGGMDRRSTVLHFVLGRSRSNRYGRRHQLPSWTIVPLTI